MTKSKMPVHREVGDKITVTTENLYTMNTSNRSCVNPGYPSQSYLDSIEKYLYVKGEVTHTFKPGYELTVGFPDGQYFHVKDNWVTGVI